jgi:hypothetical protein
MTHVRIRRIREREPKAFQIIDFLEPSRILQIIFLGEKHLWKFEFKLLRLTNDYNEIVTAMDKKKKRRGNDQKKKGEKMFRIVLNTLKALSTNVRKHSNMLLWCIYSGFRDMVLRVVLMWS